MKKLIFTAFAVVVFSSVSKANNRVVNRKAVFLNDNCCALYNLAYNLAISEGANWRSASSYATQVEANCLEESQQMFIEAEPNDFKREIIRLEP